MRFLISAGLAMPALALLFELSAMGTKHFLSSYLSTLLIAEICLTICDGGTHLLLAGEKFYYLRRGWLYVRPSIVARVLRSSMFMLPALGVSTYVMRLLGRHGYPEWKDFSLNIGGAITFGLMALVLTVVFGMRQEAQVARNKAENTIRTLENAHLQAQVHALTAQMNPHLLFNALNSIASMISTKPQVAEEMTVALAGLYRRALGSTSGGLHPLAEELELVRSHLKVEEGRFEDRIRFDIDVAKNLNPATTMVPVFCLQPLVENAIKHGLQPRAEGGQGWIRASMVDSQTICLVVEDDGVGIGCSPRHDGSKTALSNFRERLRLLYGEVASMTISSRTPMGTKVQLLLPVNLPERISG